LQPGKLDITSIGTGNVHNYSTNLADGRKAPST
jgi:hypothetical protein